MPLVHCAAYLVLARHFRPSSQTAPSPIVISASRSICQWVIPVEIDGKKLRMYLDDEHPSGVSAFYAKTQKLDATIPHSISIAGHQLGSVTLSTDVPTESDIGFDGLLGIDVLQDCAVGMDFAASTVTLWPNGGIEADAARSWVKGGELRAGTLAKPRVWEAPLVSDPMGLIAVAAKVGSREFLTRLLISATDPYIPTRVLNTPEAATLEKLTGGVRIISTADFHLGSMGPVASVVTGAPEDGFEPEEGYIGADFLNSRRVLMDFSHRRVYEQVLDEQTRSAMTFSTHFSIPVHLEGNELRLGPLDEQPSAPISRTNAHDGDRILSFRGLDAKVYIDFIKSGASCTAKQANAFYRMIRGKPNVLRVMHAGKPVAYTLPKQ